MEVNLILCIHVFLLGLITEARRQKRDLVFENMIMRTKKFSPQDNDAPSPMVGGGILERRIISARNGTEGNHAEDREMECCHHVLVGGDQFGGIHHTHPYITGQYKKIGVCDGRSLYQNINNTEIFIYYVCGRWFIGLEIGVCGGWVFTKTFDICVHSNHEGTWNFISELGLQEDRSFKVKDACEEPTDPPGSGSSKKTNVYSSGAAGATVGGFNFMPHQDYVDRTDLRGGKGEKKQHTANIGALYKQPLLDYNVHQGNKKDENKENNNYLLSLLY